MSAGTEQIKSRITPVTLCAQSYKYWVMSRDERARLQPQELDVMLKQVASRLLQVHLFLMICHSYGVYQVTTASVS